jgi:hypothetical protein
MYCTIRNSYIFFNSVPLQSFQLQWKQEFQLFSLNFMLKFQKSYCTQLPSYAREVEKKSLMFTNSQIISTFTQAFLLPMVPYAVDKG